jgi:hypothetical protein
MSSLAKVPPRHTAPVERSEPSLVPQECPRCGVDLEGALREVDLVLTLDDGAETKITGYECGACGWCCAPTI